MTLEIAEWLITLSPFFMPGLTMTERVVDFLIRNQSEIIVILFILAAITLEFVWVTKFENKGEKK